MTSMSYVKRKKNCCESNTVPLLHNSLYNLLLIWCLLAIIRLSSKHSIEHSKLPLHYMLLTCFYEKHHGGLLYCIPMLSFYIKHSLGLCHTVQ